MRLPSRFFEKIGESFYFKKNGCIMYTYMIIFLQKENFM